MFMCIYIYIYICVHTKGGPGDGARGGHLPGGAGRVAVVESVVEKRLYYTIDYTISLYTYI